MKITCAIIVVCGLLAVAGTSPAQTWTWTQTSAPNLPWTNIVMSADGNKLAIVSTGVTGAIYTSTNFGVNWVSNSVPLGWPNGPSVEYGWTALASSANGSNLIAASSENLVCASTNAGATWFWPGITQSLPSDPYFTSLAMSADGTRIAGTAGNVYLSTNFGVTFTNIFTNSWADSITMGANGRVIVFGFSEEIDGGVEISTNYGKTWFFKNEPYEAPDTTAVSADGKTIAMVGSGFISTSTNYFATYHSFNLNPYWQRVAIAMSADGSKIYASRDGLAPDLGWVYFCSSMDYGQTWTTNVVPGAGVIDFVTCSADGNKLAFAGFDTNNSSTNVIFTACLSPSPQINLTTGPTNPALSWTVPSTNMVLEESPDLNEWAIVTNTPSLDFTNLQEQLTVSPTNNAGYFRLISQ